MEISTVAGLVSSVGFPILAACWMFVQYDKLRGTLEDNIKVITELKGLIERVIDKLDDKGDV